VDRLRLLSKIKPLVNFHKCFISLSHTGGWVRLECLCPMEMFEWMKLSEWWEIWYHTLAANRLSGPMRGGFSRYIGPGPGEPRRGLWISGEIFQGGTRPFCGPVDELRLLYKIKPLVNFHKCFISCTAEFRSLSEFYIIIFLNKLKIVENAPKYEKIKIKLLWLIFRGSFIIWIFQENYFDLQSVFIITKLMATYIDSTTDKVLFVNIIF
jgi:hypothetical protein